MDVDTADQLQAIAQAVRRAKRAGADETATGG
jgi:hypothetical protein